jgi:hypothetical protein
MSTMRKPPSSTARVLRRALAAALLLLIAAALCWKAAHLVGEQKVRRFIRTLKTADAVVIEGSFVDRDIPARKTLRVRLSNRDDIDAIAACFDSTQPTLRYGDSLFTTIGAETLDAVRGSLSIENGGRMTTLSFVGVNGFVPNRFTYLQLDGFSANDLYDRIKQRGLLPQAVGH